MFLTVSGYAVSEEIALISYASKWYTDGQAGGNGVGGPVQKKIDQNWNVHSIMFQ